MQLREGMACPSGRLRGEQVLETGVFCPSTELASWWDQGWGILESLTSLPFQQGAFPTLGPGGLVWDGRCWERQGEARRWCLSGCGRELAARMLEGALGCVHWQLEELLQGHRGGAWVHGEVGRGDGAPCQPGWHSRDRGLPTVASTTPLFLRLRLRAGFVGVTRCWPQGPGLLPWFRGEADSMPAALSYSGSREEHVLDRFMQGGTGYMRRMAGPGLGQSPSGGRQTFRRPV